MTTVNPDGSRLLSIIVPDITNGDPTYASTLYSAALEGATAAVSEAGLTSFTDPRLVAREHHLIERTWVRMARFEVSAR